MAATTRELPACPVETTLTLISSKWKVLIVRDLLGGTKRFGELQRSVGNVSQKVLTAQLREMEEDGLVDRKVYPEVPPRVEYSLTELGRSLEPVLSAMWNWGEEYRARSGEALGKSQKKAKNGRRLSGAGRFLLATAGRCGCRSPGSWPGSASGPRRSRGGGGGPGG